MIGFVLEASRDCLNKIGLEIMSDAVSGAGMGLLHDVEVGRLADASVV